MKLASAVALVSLVSVASGAEAKTIHLRAPSESLSLVCTQSSPPLNWSFTSGGWYQGARTALLNTANFGPGGVVPDDIAIGTPFDTMDPQDLDGADILVLNPVSIPIDWVGLKVFGTYARGGVGFISFQNSALTFFADKGGCVGDNTADITGPGAGTQIIGQTLKHLDADTGTALQMFVGVTSPGCEMS